MSFAETDNWDLYNTLKKVCPLYKCYHHLPMIYSPANFHRNQHNIFGKVTSFNVLCVARTGPDAVPVPPSIMHADLDLHRGGGVTFKQHQTAAWMKASAVTRGIL